MILKRPAFAILFCALPFLASAPARASLIVRLVPGLQTGEIGGPAFLGVYADVGAEDAFVSFGLDVNYDPTALQAVDARLNPALFTGFQLPPDLSVEGVVGLNGFVPLPLDPVSGTVQLALLEFRILTVGPGLVSVSFDGPTQGFGLPYPPGDVILPDRVENASVGAVPEPASWAAFALGLAGMAPLLRGRRRRARAA